MSRSDEFEELIRKTDEDAYALANSLLTERKPGDARRHNFIPRFLLNRFADDTNHLWTVDLMDGTKTRKAAVTDTAVITDYHTIDQPEIGLSNAIEGVRAQVENLAAPALERIAYGVLPPNKQDRFALAMWAAQLFCLSPPVRRHMEASADLLSKALMENRPGTLPSADYEVVLPQNNQLRMGLQVAEQATHELFSMHIAVLKSASTGIATGDCPLWMHPADDQNHLEGVGFLTTPEIRLPVDRSTQIVFHRDEALGDTVMSVDEPPQELARTMAETTCRNLYCHPEDLHLYDDLGGVAADRPIIPGSHRPESVDGLGSAPNRVSPRRFGQSRGK